MNFPKAVEIIEVGPRDGFQNITKWIPTDLKLQVIDWIVEANFSKVEITSFVHPDAIPQMKDAETIARYVTKKYKDEFSPIALVPNLYGTKKAFESGIREITYVISASEAHNKANVNRTIQESLNELKTIKTDFPQLKIKLDIATVFGCSISGKVPVENVVNLINESIAINVDSICLCDTIGTANPAQIKNVLNQIKAECSTLDYCKTGLHFHNTRGMGLANVLMAMDCGITVFESSLGGLGGCPFAPGASGNIATEDLVHMLDSMNIDTGIDTYKLQNFAKQLKGTLPIDY